MRFVRLSEEEKSELERLYKTSPNSVVRNRCLSLLYSNEQRSIKDVSQLAHVSRRSLERLFDSWESSQNKYKTLSISDGRGAKVKLAPVKDLLADLVKEHSRNLNPILEELESKHNIRVCKLTLQNFLKDLGI
jgi:transposase